MNRTTRNEWDSCIDFKKCKWIGSQGNYGDLLLMRYVPSADINWGLTYNIKTNSPKENPETKTKHNPNRKGIIIPNSALQSQISVVYSNNYSVWHQRTHHYSQYNRKNYFDLRKQLIGLVFLKLGIL